MATIVDVAKLAGVSVATVSNAISGNRNVSPELQKAVWAAIGQLSYIPNANARGLRNNGTELFGILVPDITDPFFSGLVRFAERDLQKQGFQVILADTNEDPDIEARRVRSLIGLRVRGLIIAPTRDEHSSELLSMTNHHVKPVFIDRIPTSSPATSIGIDNEKAAYEATNHMIERGHRKIAIVANNYGLTNMAERIRGYRRALQSHDLAADQQLEIYDDSTQPSQLIKSISTQIASLFSTGRTPKATALLATTSRLASYTLRALRVVGARVPGDISLITFDDPEWANLTDPPLTAVAQPIEAMASAAAQIVMYGEPSDITGRVLIFPHNLVIRASVVPARGN